MAPPANPEDPLERERNRQTATPAGGAQPPAAQGAAPAAAAGDADYNRRMRERYGLTDADLQDPDTQRWLNKQNAKRRQEAGQPKPPTGGTESQPPAGGAQKPAGPCPDGSTPTQMQCFREPCPPPRCADGSTPSGGFGPRGTGSESKPAPQTPGGGPQTPGPYPPPPGGGYPPSGWGQGYYGGPGTTQRAGWPGQPGYQGQPGQIYQNSPMSYPPPGPYGYGPHGAGPYGPYGGGTTPPGQYPQYPGAAGPYGGFIPPWQQQARFNPGQAAQAMMMY